MTRKTVIMGAAGRDFHDFNVMFRDDDTYEVVAFTQTFSQNIGELDEIPEREYPPSLAGDLYPEGIPIRPERQLETIIAEHDVDEVVLSYSDLSHDSVMQQASRALAAGADFRLIGTEVMLEADVPVVAVDAVRTGCGKSQVSRKLATLLKNEGLDVVVVREPMPYGDLEAQRVQRFETLEDIDAAGVTIEEREEYEHHVEEGHVVYSGVDYAAILDEAQAEADLILWDGGNNELPFYAPDLHFVLADPHRPGDETSYHPGETNLHLADYVVINKENTADPSDIHEVVQNVRSVNSEAGIIHADSVVDVDEPGHVRGKRVVAVEDGPTLTHGGTKTGAAAIAAEKYGAAELVDPRDDAVGSIRSILDEYPHLETVIPAMGYSDGQIAELEESINATDADVVLAGTPIDLAKVIDVNKPVIRVRYAVDEHNPPFEHVLKHHADRLGM